MTSGYSVSGQRLKGFTYAVTMTGTTGGSASGRLRCWCLSGSGARAPPTTPVLAGFGVRSADQVRSLVPHCDGVIVGSALVEVLARGDDPVAFSKGLRP